VASSHEVPIYRVSLKSLPVFRGHITITPRGTGMAPGPNSTSGYVDMPGILKKSIRIFLDDLRPI
jgi:hypothetical protein